MVSRLQIKKTVEENYLKRKILLEIGIGYGEFFAWLSDNGKFLCFGTDTKENRINKSLRKLENPNGIIIYSDAKSVLYDIFPYQSIDRIIINFPDPWPEKRNFKKRLTYINTLKLIDSRLKVNGSIMLATDNENYMTEFTNNILSLGNFEKMFKPSPLKNVYRGFATRYETTWLNNGRALYYQTFKKKTPSENFYHIKVTSFPNITMKNGNLHKKIKNYDNWLIKSEVLNNKKIKLIIVEKNLQIRYTLLLEPDKNGKLKLSNENEIVFFDKLKVLLEDFFENSGD